MSNDEYKLTREYEMTVFINKAGTITIIQKSDSLNPDDGDDMIVIGSLHRARELAKAILALSKIATFKMEGEE